MLEQEVPGDLSGHPLSQARNGHEDRLRQAREGDGSAFSDLVRDLHAPLCSYLARLVGNDEFGRDLAQETLIRAWTSLPELREEQHFKAWLYRIATNLARSHLRRAYLIRWLPWTQTEKETSPALRIKGPEEQISETDLIQTVLAHLSPQYRTCLLLQVMAGFSQREIAHLLGISEKSVGSNVCRGREQFRRIYTSLKGDAE
ncbi:MAG: RNA polymerase sigma factor [Chloroflexi bacterium]|nr:RNA polymerase sigma factor [Chloroflexota bacterium]